MSGRNIILATVLTVFVATAPVWGQSTPRTNVEVLGDLAVDCIGHVPDTLSSILVDPSGGMPYLRPRLTEHWKGEGLRVYLADSTASDASLTGLHRLKYAPDDASIAYRSIEHSRLERTVALSVSYSLTAPAGLLVVDDRCMRERTDTIDRSAILIVERDPFPEARGDVPPEGSWRTWAEPVVLAAAVGVVAYLFFSIRSS